METPINCCILALVAFAGNIVQLLLFFNYSLKLKERSVELKKQEENHEQRIQWVESDLSLVKAFEKGLQKKNGKELREIKKLKGEIRLLKALMIVKTEKDQEQSQENDENDEDGEWND